MLTMTSTTLSGLPEPPDSMTETEAAANLGTALATFAAQQLPADVARRAVVIPDGNGRFRVEDIGHLLPKPFTITNRFAAHSASSFCLYVTTFGGITRSLIFADRTKHELVAILDYHESLEPNTQSHRAHYVAAIEPRFEAWTKKASQWMPQKDFAEFIEENATDIIEPESAAMLEVSRGLEGTRQVRFKSSQNLTNGDREFAYQQETTTGTTTGKIAVPSKVKIRVPVFRFEEPIEVEALLRFDINSNGEIRFRLVFLRLQDVIDQAFSRVAARVEEGTNRHALFVAGAN